MKPSASLSLPRSTVAASLFVLVTGCVPRLDGDDTSLFAAPALATGGRSRADVALVVVDADATLPLTPGESVGLFVQYARGGHWNLSTTCDTRASGQSCSFDVLVSPASGSSFSAVEGHELSQDDTLELRSDGSVRLVTATSSGTNGMTFDSDPGALVEVDALLDGAVQERLVHLVSDGSVVEGVPTNPVHLSPSAP
jgi:hypothetical protein